VALPNNDYIGWMKKKVEPKKKLKKEMKVEANKPALQKDERFDFGGLPEMNLKKNLGCG
jgi:hypothetical protein